MRILHHISEYIQKMLEEFIRPEEGITHCFSKEKISSGSVWIQGEGKMIAAKKAVP